jgi:hypothetical protein
MKKLFKILCDYISNFLFEDEDLSRL